LVLTYQRASPHPNGLFIFIYIIDRIASSLVSVAVGRGGFVGGGGKVGAGGVNVGGGGGVSVASWRCESWRGRIGVEVAVAVESVAGRK